MMRKTGESRKYATNVGRSFHKIPNSNLVSFISKEDEKWFVKSLNPLTGAIEVIMETLPNVEDICWLSDGSLLFPTKNIIPKRMLSIRILGKRPLRFGIEFVPELKCLMLCKPHDITKNPNNSSSHTTIQSS